MHSEGKANRKERLEIRKSGLHTNACQDSETWDVNLENGIQMGDVYLRAEGVIGREIMPGVRSRPACIHLAFNEERRPDAGDRDRNI